MLRSQAHCQVAKNPQPKPKLVNKLASSSRTDKNAQLPTSAHTA